MGQLFKAQPNVVAGVLSAFVCSSPFPCSLIQTHSRRTHVWNPPASQRSPSVRASPAYPRLDPLPTLRMELNLNQQTPVQQPVTETFPLKPRAAVAVAACRFPVAGSIEWLLIQRGKEPNYGEWSLPGGSVELGENTLEAAKREFLEETCLGEDQASFFPESFMTSDAIYRDKEGRMKFHYVIAQTFAVCHPEAEPTASDDAMDAQWFSREQLAELVASKDLQVSSGVTGVVERAEKLWRAGCLELSRIPGQ